MRYTILFFFSTLNAFASLTLCLGSSRNNGNADNSLFPIGNLQASLTASEGQGTVVAIQSPKRSCDHDGIDDFVLLVSRSPREPACNLTRSNLNFHYDNGHDDDGVDAGGGAGDYDKEDIALTSILTPIAFRGAVKAPFGKVKTSGSTYLYGGKTESKTLHVLHEQAGICIAMTGFLSDVRHLVRYVANSVSDYEYIYAGGTPSIHSLVRDTMASYIRDATTAGGARPFGVQALLVGNEGGGGSFSSRDEKIQIFALDPSGNFRHCIGGVGTIGKNAENVRKSVCSIIKEGEIDWNGSSAVTIQHSLDIAMKSIIENSNDINELSPRDRKEAHQFEAIVVFGRRKQLGQQYSCAVLNDDFIFGAYRRCVEDILRKHQSKR